MHLYIYDEMVSALGKYIHVVGDIVFVVLQKQQNTFKTLLQTSIIKFHNLVYMNTIVSPRYYP